MKKLFEVTKKWYVLADGRELGEVILDVVTQIKGEVPLCDMVVSPFPLNIPVIVELARLQEVARNEGRKEITHIYTYDDVVNLTKVIIVEAQGLEKWE